MRTARPVVLTPDDQKLLEARARARRAPARSVERARIVLLAASGLQDKEIATQLRITPEKAARWRNRYLDLGLPGLEKDAPRPGRTPTIGPDKLQEVIDKAAESPTTSARAVARAVGISDRTVRRIWQKARAKAR